MRSITLRVGTRGSRLALWQARSVRERLDAPSEEVVIKTSGDVFHDRALSDSDAVGFFTREIEERLLGGQIDLAVHSLKDLPTRLAPGLAIGALLPRDDPGDVLLLRPEGFDPTAALSVAAGTLVGASSLRRQALLKQHAPQAVPVPVRGNVPTRVEKVKAKEYAGIILARAGLLRLGLSVDPLMAFDLNPCRWICAPGQAIIAVEIRQGDVETRRRVAALNDAATRSAAELERDQLMQLGGGCHAPLGAYARRLESGRWELFVAAPGPEGFSLARFEAASPSQLSIDAASWHAAGRPPRPLHQEEEWICRPARQWS